VDFAAESTEFARQQLLMQSAISVLQQSSQAKQALLSLLR
jgi:flagellin-like hook-associated protein FlgL